MTTLSQIDADAATITRTVRIEAPRELVWAALTTPDQIARWFGQTADFPGGVHLGATGTFGWTAHGDFPVRIDAYDPTSHFAFTWGNQGEEIREDNSTTATFTLAEADGATRLTVVESGFDTLTPDAVARRAAMEDNAQGWNSELDELVAHVGALQHGSAPVADLDAGTITHSVLVAASRETTWAALVSPEAIEAWWGHPAVFPDGVAPGSLGTFEWVDHGLFPVLIETVDRPERFAFTWGELGEQQPGPTSTLVTFTLAAAGEQTVVTVVETGFENQEAAARRAAMEGNVEGWTLVLASLQRHLQVPA